MPNSSNPGHFARHRDLTGVGQQYSHDQFQQRRFAGTVAPDQANGLAAPDREGNAFQHMMRRMADPSEQRLLEPMMGPLEGFECLMDIVEANDLVLKPVHRYASPDNAPPFSRAIPALSSPRAG